MKKLLILSLLFNVAALGMLVARWCAGSSRQVPINTGMFQELEIYQAKKGTSALELSKILKSGEASIGEDYKKRMLQLGVLGDDSYVFETEGRVFLISHYVHARPRDKEFAGPLKEIPGMKAYQDQLSPFFDKAPATKLTPANSFWNAVYIK